MGHQVVLSPAGRLMLEETAEAAGLLAAFVPAFAASSGAGLLALAAERSPGFTWPAEAQFWREFAGTFLHGIARAPEGEADLAGTEVLPPGGLFSELTLRRRHEEACLIAQARRGLSHCPHKPDDTTEYPH